MELAEIKYINHRKESCFKG